MRATVNPKAMLIPTKSTEIEEDLAAIRECDPDYKLTPPTVEIEGVRYIREDMVPQVSSNEGGIDEDAHWDAETRAGR